MSKVDVYQGDSREILRVLPDASVDAVVTDPPYALVSIVQRYGSADAKPTTADVYARSTAGFMGRRWDTGETAFAVEFWREVYRVLKPGGHIVAASGTRTYHRLACAIEDAGFEIRDAITDLISRDAQVQAFADSLSPAQESLFAKLLHESPFGGMLAWIYGSGFPKSRDVAKAIDGIDAEEARRARALMFTAWMRSTGLPAEQINFLTGTVMASHYLSERSQPAIPTADLFDHLRPYLPPVPAWVEQMVAERTIESENLKARKVVGRHDQGSAARAWDAKFAGSAMTEAGAITQALTEDALKWDGWGTALKPALEPFVLARKPLDGTVAANVLKHGVGALNIDGCRVEGGKSVLASPRRNATGGDAGGVYGRLEPPRGDTAGWDPTAGRWPANVIHDGSDEVLNAFPDVAGQKAPVTGLEPSAATGSVWNPRARTASPTPRADGGTAGRFFYSAKADTEDRLGSEHPTVKPVDLMAWLVRLVCPAGGVVLDPFAGSGTTGLAAMREGCDAILIEREDDHADDIRRRIAWARGDGGLTSQEVLRHKLAKDPAAAGGAGLPLFGEAVDD